MNRARTWLNATCAFWALVFVAGHAVYLDTPFVNQEFAFSEATRSLLDPSDALGMRRYWATQANPLGYSLVSAVLVSLLGGDVTFWSVRIPSLLGLLAILLSGRLFAGRLGLTAAFPLFAWAGLTALEPLVWLHGGQATADVLPVGLLALALALCHTAGGRWWAHLLAASCFGLAILVKFNALLCAPAFLCLIVLNRHGSSRRPWHPYGQLLCYAVIPGVLLAVYFALIRHRFGIILLEDRFKQRHFEADWNSYPQTAAMYLSYLALALGPAALLAPARLYSALSRRQFAILVSVAAAVSVFFAPALSAYNVGEMDFGGLTHFLPAAGVALVRCAGLLLGLLVIADLVRAAVWQRSGVCALVLSLVVPYLVVCSLFRPAQRYLLFCIPAVLFSLVFVTAQSARRWLVAATGLGLALFLAANIVLAAYQVAQATAAERMAQWAVAHGVAERTDPGPVYHHAGQHFPPYGEDQAAMYVISTEPPARESVIHEERVILFGRVIRVYYLARSERAAWHGGNGDDRAMISRIGLP